MYVTPLIYCIRIWHQFYSKPCFLQPPEGPAPVSWNQLANPSWRRRVTPSWRRRVPSSWRRRVTPSRRLRVTPSRRRRVTPSWRRRVTLSRRRRVIPSLGHSSKHDPASCFDRKSKYGKSKSVHRPCGGNRRAKFQGDVPMSNDHLQPVAHVRELLCIHILAIILTLSTQWSLINYLFVE